MLSNLNRLVSSLITFGRGRRGHGLCGFRLVLGFGRLTNQIVFEISLNASLRYDHHKLKKHTLTRRHTLLVELRGEKRGGAGQEVSINGQESRLDDGCS